ncbi:hypothetical protein DPMN_002812 [Dreissena polymorpha]|uniref:Uncharacterized protein n=1 Tax=Dreissena polymorpha TaxID=45954 RepID=A0A9D4RRK8_DREPO|nr:hypothetical protein DPMN_002812 [Dreissena polymorpha]
MFIFILFVGNYTIPETLTHHMTHISLCCRFLGTTVESSSVLPLLQSLVQQLSMLGNQSPRSGLVRVSLSSRYRTFFLKDE